MIAAMINNQSKIVFLPGFGFQASIWQNIAERLTNHQAILLDLPVLENNSITEAVDSLIAQIPDNSNIVAWSLGGLLAIDLCDKAAHKVKKLILVSSALKFTAGKNWPGVSDHEIKQFSDLLQHDAQQLLEIFAKLIQYPQRSLAIKSALRSHLLYIATTKQSLYHYFNFLANADYRLLCGRLTLPVLQIFGELDPIIPKEQSLKVKALYPDHHIALIKSAGHIPFLSHVESFMQLLNHFINDHNTACQ